MVAAHSFTLRAVYYRSVLGLAALASIGLSLGGCAPKPKLGASAALAAERSPLRRADSTDWAYLPDDGLPTACLSSAAQAPDTSHLEFWPLRRIRLGFRVIDRPGAPLNLDSASGVNRIGDILYTANGLLADLPRSWLPVGAPPPQTPSRFRLVTASNPGTPHGYDVTFHRDADVPLHVHTGRARNIGDGTAFARYGARADSVLDVLLLPIDPAPRAPLDQPTGIVGVAIGSRYLKLAAPRTQLKCPDKK